MNIAFEYLYRDAGNYKNWNTVVFSNRDAVDPDVYSRTHAGHIGRSSIEGVFCCCIRWMM